MPQAVGVHDEVPHRMSAFVWTVKDEKTLFEIVAKEHEEYVSSVEEAWEVIKDDLNSCFILTQEQAENFKYSGHQAHEVRFEIARALREEHRILDFNSATGQVFRVNT